MKNLLTTLCLILGAVSLSAATLQYNPVTTATPPNMTNIIKAIAGTNSGTGGNNFSTAQFGTNAGNVVLTNLGPSAIPGNAAGLTNLPLSSIKTNGAGVGQVATFNGTEWTAADPTGSAGNFSDYSLSLMSNGVNTNFVYLSGSTNILNDVHPPLAGQYALERYTSLTDFLYTNGTYFIAGINPADDPCASGNQVVVTNSSGQYIMLNTDLIVFGGYGSPDCATTYGVITRYGTNTVGNFSGTLSGTNTVDNAQTTSNLQSLAQFKYFRMNPPVNRSILKPVWGKIYSNQPVTILAYNGGGWISDGVLNYVYRELTNMLPVRGGFGKVISTADLNAYAGITWNSSGTFQTNAALAIDGDLWINHLVVLTNGASMTWAKADGTVNGATGQVFRLDYIHTPVGGDFKVQTNYLNSTTFSDATVFSNGVALTTVSGLGATNGDNIYWTNLGQPTAVRAIGTSVGTNYFVGPGNTATNLTNGIQWAAEFSDGANYDQAVRATTNTQGPIFKSWNPDLVLMPMWGDTQDNPDTYWLKTNLFDVWIPNVPVVIVGLWPRVTDEYAIRLAQRKTALALHMAYWDSVQLFNNDTNLMIQRGWLNPANSHLPQAGFDVHSRGLSEWLDLFNSDVDR